jgi:hypothetical protein
MVERGEFFAAWQFAGGENAYEVALTTVAAAHGVLQPEQTGEIRRPEP